MLYEDGKYFEQESLPTSKETGLGNVATKEANAAVEKVLEQERNGGRKRKYMHFTLEQRAKMGRYTGNISALRHFSKEFPSLGESTVRLFKKQ